MMFPRPFRVVSEALTKSAKGQTCTLRLGPFCLHAERVILAHIDGHSPGAKGDDSHAVYACQECHDCYDGRAHRDFARAYPSLILDRVIRALSETHHRMIAAGLITVEGWER